MLMLLWRHKAGALTNKLSRGLFQNICQCSTNSATAIAIIAIPATGSAGPADVPAFQNL
jgi:hypothetical protein